MSLTQSIVDAIVSKLGENHIMLSYQWDTQTLVKAVYTYVNSRGIPVWMDIKGGMMGQDTQDAMAEGVENAVAIIPFMTEKYQASYCCEQELKYADVSKVSVIPCMVQEKASNGTVYRARGWLGLITAGKLWTDFRGINPDDADQVKQKTDGLLLEIATKMGVDTSDAFAEQRPAEQPAPTPAPAQAPAPAPAKAKAPANAKAPAKAKAKAPAPQRAPPPQSGDLSFLLDCGKIIRLRGHHGMFIRSDPSQVVACDAQDPNRVSGCDLELVDVRPGVYGIKSTNTNKFLSAQPNGTMEWNRDILNIWEHFTFTRVKDKVIAIYTFHGTYLSAQPGGRLEGNRKEQQAWEHFTVAPGNMNFTDNVDHLITNKTIVLKGYHSMYVSGVGHGKVECSTYSMTDKMCMVRAYKMGPRKFAFQNVGTGMYLSAQQKNGELQWNRPQAQGWETFHVQILVDNVISLKSFHGKYVSAQPSGQLVADRDNAQAWECFQVFKCDAASTIMSISGQMICLKNAHNTCIGQHENKPIMTAVKGAAVFIVWIINKEDNKIALISIMNHKFLSAQPNGTLEWNRGEVKEWETFTVVPINDAKIAFKSYHGKFICADGKQLIANRGEAKGWEHFEVYPVDIMDVLGPTPFPFALKGHTGKYIRAEDKPVCNGTDIRKQTKCQIKFVKMPGTSKCAVMSIATKKFLSAQSNKTLQWNRGEAKGWETFDMIIMDVSKIALKSCHGFFVSCQKDGKLEANRPSAQGWETFKMDIIL